MAQYLEVAMIICFGISWPINLIKSYRSRSTRGKSLGFLIFIFSGYLCGIAGKLSADEINWFVLSFYLLNTVMVAGDLLMYVRNYRLDKKREAANAVS